MCFLFPLRSYADPFEWAYRHTLTPRYRRYSSTASQSDCRFSLPFPYLIFGLSTASVEIEPALPPQGNLRPSSVVNPFGHPPSDPVTFSYTHLIAWFFSCFRHMKTLAFVHHGIFRSPILSLALRLTSSLAPASLDSLPQLG